MRMIAFCHRPLCQQPEHVSRVEQFRQRGIKYHNDIADKAENYFYVRKLHRELAAYLRDKTELVPDTKAATHSAANKKQSNKALRTSIELISEGFHLPTTGLRNIKASHGVNNCTGQFNKLAVVQPRASSSVNSWAKKKRAGIVVNVRSCSDVSGKVTETVMQRVARWEERTKCRSVTKLVEVESAAWKMDLGQSSKCVSRNSKGQCVTRATSPKSADMGAGTVMVPKTVKDCSGTERVKVYDEVPTEIPIREGMRVTGDIGYVLSTGYSYNRKFDFKGGSENQLAEKILGFAKSHYIDPINVSRPTTLSLVAKTRKAAGNRPARTSDPMYQEDLVLEWIYGIYPRLPKSLDKGLLWKRYAILRQEAAYYMAEMTPVTSKKKFLMRLNRNY